MAIRMASPRSKKTFFIVCPNHAHNRRRLCEAVGIERFHEILLTGKGHRAVDHEQGFPGALLTSKRADGSCRGQGEGRQ